MDKIDWSKSRVDFGLLIPCDSFGRVISDSIFIKKLTIKKERKIPREFKNPASGVVFDRYRKLKTPLDLKKENALYYWQVIAQMACLDAPYMQWIAYDCDIKSDNPADKFVIIDFERDLEVEKVLIDSLYKAVQYIQSALIG